MQQSGDRVGWGRFLFVVILWAWPSALFLPVIRGLDQDSWTLRAVSIAVTLLVGILLCFLVVRLTVIRIDPPRWLAPTALVAVLAASIVVIPAYFLAVSRGYLGGLGGDRGQVLEIAWARLKEGLNPYTYVNEGGNHISNLPGDIALSAPAVLSTKNAGLMTVYVVPISMLLIWIRDRLAFPVIAFGVLLAPAFWADTLSRGELVTTAILMFALGAVVLSSGTAAKLKSGWWLWPIALGVVASTRVTNVVVVLLVAALVWGAGRRGIACVQVLIAGGAFLAVTVPFYLWDPEGFGAMTAQMDHSGGLLGSLAVAATIAILVAVGANSKRLRSWRPISALALLVSLYAVLSTIFPMIAQAIDPPGPVVKIVGLYVSGYAVLALTAPLILLAHRGGDRSLR